MLELSNVAPSSNLIIDIKYSTCDNFLGRPIYKSDHASLRPEALSKFSQAVNLAMKHGFTVHLLDSFRPQAAQDIIWQAVQNPQFVSVPLIDDNGAIISGSAHTRGIAIDVALSFRGKILQMPSDYDDFSEKASIYKSKGIALSNAKILKTIFSCSGFMPHPIEWWHFELPNAFKYAFISDVEL